MNPTSPDAATAATGAAAAGYGLWPLVLINTGIFIAFAFSFYKPRTARDWRTFGAFSGFLLALFTEMYGFPLTIYVLSGWLTSRSPNADLLAHNSGHLWNVIFDLPGDPHVNPLHFASYVPILGGFWLLSRAWPVLHRAQRDGTVARTGPYAHIRHPQYVAFALVMLGLLLQWPTLPTLAMFPVLLVAYARLARREEREARAALGDDYARYAAATPAFVPRVGRLTGPAAEPTA
jgi:methanethiol S-methyltransferase